VTWCFPFSIAKISPHLLLPSLFRARDPPTVTRRSRRESRWVSDFFAAVVRTSAIAHRARKTLYCQTECTRRVGRGGAPCQHMATHHLTPSDLAAMHACTSTCSGAMHRHACMHGTPRWPHAHSVGRCTSPLCVGDLFWYPVRLRPAKARAVLAWLQPALSSPLVPRVSIISACALVAWSDIACSNERQFRHCVGVDLHVRHALT
jgi:hypothetical protein